jgi:hypothetical protein
MDFKSCFIINDNFTVADDGTIICVLSGTPVIDSVEKAYVFINLFFHDIIEIELNKLIKKIHDKTDAITAEAGIDATATDKLFPQLSSMFKQELGDNSFDGLIKLELAKIKPHISLDLSKEEEEIIERMHDALYFTEFEKFRNTVLLPDKKPNNPEPKEIIFSPKYIASLSLRAKRLLGPAIKMCAYMIGRQFAQFTLSPEFKLTYLWSSESHQFNEEDIKNRIKAIMAGN